MSVILGINNGATLTIAGDKRGTSIDGKIIQDDLEKVVVINKQLAFASGGNAAIGKAIQMDVEKSDIAKMMTTNALLEIIYNFYHKLTEQGASKLLLMPFSFIIAGLDQNQQLSLVAGTQKNQEIEARECEMILFPPADVSMQRCSEVLAKYYKLKYDDYIEQTIKEISEQSQFVSATGNKWMYNLKTSTGRFYSF